MRGDDCLRLAATQQAPGIARRRVAAACDGLDGDAAEIAELLTSELVTNAVVHPERGGLGMDDGITVLINRSATSVRVAVHDEDARQIPRPALSHEVLDEHGRGLRLVSQLASVWGTYVPPRGGKTVWFEVTAKPHLHQGRSGSSTRHVRGDGPTEFTSFAEEVLSRLGRLRVRLARGIALCCQPPSLSREGN